MGKGKSFLAIPWDVTQKSPKSYVWLLPRHLSTACQSLYSLSGCLILPWSPPPLDRPVLKFIFKLISSSTLFLPGFLWEPFLQENQESCFHPSRDLFKKEQAAAGGSMELSPHPIPPLFAVPNHGKLANRLRTLKQLLHLINTKTSGSNPASHREPRTLKSFLLWQEARPYFSPTRSLGLQPNLSLPEN